MRISPLQTEFIDDRYEPPNPTPRITYLAFSAGSQSTAILEMVLRGEIERPEHFLVLAADPGMEDPRTYVIRDALLDRCRQQGIYCEVVSKGNLRLDGIKAAKSGTRYDNPPLWTLDAKGKMGQLLQGCTQEYKIKPMRRAVQRYAKESFGATMRVANSVEAWIGFAWDERHRVKPSDVKYVQHRYPLIDRKLTKKTIRRWFATHGIAEPPMSVCNACFANGLRKLAELHDLFPQQWEEACEYDEAIRDGLKASNRCYVSRTCIPLRELAANGFLADGGERISPEFSCDSGYCFT